MISLYPVKLVFRNGAYLFDLEWTLRDLLVDLYMKSPGMFNFFLLLLLVCLSCMSVGGRVCVCVPVGSRHMWLAESKASCYNWWRKRVFGPTMLSTAVCSKSLVLPASFNNNNKNNNK